MSLKVSVVPQTSCPTEYTLHEFLRKAPSILRTWLIQFGVFGDVVCALSHDDGLGLLSEQLDGSVMSSVSNVYPVLP